MGMNKLKETFSSRERRTKIYRKADWVSIFDRKEEEYRIEVGNIR